MNEIEEPVRALNVGERSVLLEDDELGRLADRLVDEVRLVPRATAWSSAEARRVPMSAAVPFDAVEPLPAVTVEHRHGDQFAIHIRDHVVVVDQPADVGGDDVGPTPTELFVASLVSCVAFYAHRHLRRHRLDSTGLRVTAGYRMVSRPARVSDVEIRLHLPPDFPPARRDALLAVAGHCTVHNSIVSRPAITIEVAEVVAGDLAGGDAAYEPIASAVIPERGLE